MRVPDPMPPPAAACRAGRLRTVDPRDDPLWLALAHRPDASLFTSPGWITAVCDTYGFTPCATVALDAEGNARSGFAWVPIRDLRGERSISLPFGDRAEPFVTDPTELRALTGPAIDPAAPLNVRCLTHAAQLFDQRFTATGGAAWHGTRLQGDLPHTLSRLRGTARRNLARADRAGVRVRAATDLDALRRLHCLHVDLRREKYGLLAQPWRFFEAIWQAFAPTGNLVTLLAEQDSTVVAAALLIAWNDVVYYKFGASSREHLLHRPNDAIFRAALEWALQREARLLDWGISDDDQPGLIAFKDKWASHRDRVVQLRAGGERAHVDPDSASVLAALTALFVDPAVPRESTVRAGELLYRYFC